MVKLGQQELNQSPSVKFHIKGKEITWDEDIVEHFWKNEVPPNCSVTIAELEGSGFKIIQEGIIFYKEEVKHWKAV